MRGKSILKGMAQRQKKLLFPLFTITPAMQGIFQDEHTGLESCLCRIDRCAPSLIGRGFKAKRKQNGEFRQFLAHITHTPSAHNTHPQFTAHTLSSQHTPSQHAHIALINHLTGYPFPARREHFTGTCTWPTR